MGGGGSFQISVFRVQLRSEEKTSADYADYADYLRGFLRGGGRGWKWLHVCVVSDRRESVLAPGDGFLGWVHGGD